ncbi:MAG: tRNA (5-methylaminomethyl-2-thiouridylate)-methyltransferase [Francisellaceae bacterium]|nr:tRNA (5-methylaminomethyl-2-thiouridylate)-methyltransferase [Francisellaceae bacterium]
MNTKNSKKVIVGLSGGVDSSIAAYLLQKQGFHVEGLFMKNWEEDDNAEYCSAALDLQDCEMVAEKLNIKLHTVNFSAEYWDAVFENFLEEYQKGRTPNPDILCNKEIKFKAFLDYALSLGADYIATGHYAKKVELKDNKYGLQKAFDKNKDQSYFLYTLNQEALSKTIFPLGDLTKPAIRQLAMELGFSNAKKKDSTGICFIGERKFRDFLSQYLKPNPGPIINLEGKMIGEHSGLMYFTIGQRQGLNIGGCKNTPNLPWYVAKKDLNTNALMVVQGENHPLLFTDSLLVSNLSWVAQDVNVNQFDCSAKTRYRQADVECQFHPQDNPNRALIQFKTPQRAVTPGQSIVFYLNELCLGGGIIESTFNRKELSHVT